MKQWKIARKKPVLVLFREVEGESETIQDIHGTTHIVHRNKSYILLDQAIYPYPCDKKIFEATYDVIEDDSENE